MKIHITNLYNFNKEDPLVQKQHRFANAGHSLGFLEMGIFSYPTETDTDQELSKRLDGIIASLEAEDVVFMQLPTNNGFKYEQFLFHKCKAYKNTKVVLILHDISIFSTAINQENQKQYLALFKSADAIILPASGDKQIAARFPLPTVLTYNDISAAQATSISDSVGYLSLLQNDFYIKKCLMDGIDTVLMKQNESKTAALSKSQDEVHIGFGLHDKTGNYSVWVGAAMQSIIEHTNAPLCFHILHDQTLSEPNRNKLVQVAKQNYNRIFFHLLDESIFTPVAEQTKHFTIGAMFRIMLPKLLPELGKIIYLDADLFVNRDIKELWDIDIADYYLAAVPDMGTVRGEALPLPVKRNEVASDQYINSGVLYINLDRIREKGDMKEDVLNYLYAKESLLPDQDALNVIYKDKILLLDESWNYFAQIVHRNKEKKSEKRIYHYAGARNMLYSLCEMDLLYYETILRTPWGSEECQQQLSNTFERTDDRIRQLEKLLLQISTSPKKYIFYGSETPAMKNLYRLLNVQESDYRVSSYPRHEDNYILPCKDLSVLSSESEPFIVFVLPDADDGNSIRNLENMKLVNGVDFFVIPRLLSPTQGGYV